MARWQVFLWSSIRGRLSRAVFFSVVVLRYVHCIAIHPHLASYIPVLRSSDAEYGGQRWKMQRGLTLTLDWEMLAARVTTLAACLVVALTARSTALPTLLLPQPPLPSPRPPTLPLHARTSRH